jgi:hypothetical protein
MMAAALKMPCARIRLVASGDPQKPWLALAKRASPPLVNMDYSAELKPLGKLIPVTLLAPPFSVGDRMPVSWIALMRAPRPDRLQREFATIWASCGRRPIPSMRSSLFEERAPRR